MLLGMTYRGIIGRISVCGCWLAAFTLFACSSSSGSNGGSCSSIAGCGGEIVGTWQVQSFCESNITADTSETSLCPSATVSTAGLTASGTLTFGSDRSYSTTITLSGNLRYTIPNSCLTSNGETATCAQLSASADLTGTGFTAVSCLSAGANCDCDFTLAPTTSPASGTYVLSETSVTLNSTDGGTSQDTYCATSTELRLSPLSMTMTTDMTGSMNITGQIVATKQ
jgi:hypothetical protein